MGGLASFARMFCGGFVDFECRLWSWLTSWPGVILVIGSTFFPISVDVIKNINPQGTHYTEIPLKVNLLRLKLASLWGKLPLLSI